MEAQNDDIASGNTDSRVVATLAAGSYTIEATTYNTGTTGSFDLSIGVPGGTTGASPTTDPCVEDLGSPECSGIGEWFLGLWLLLGQPDGQLCPLLFLHPG